MTLEEKLTHSLADPHMLDMLKRSVETVLRDNGWKEGELSQATDLLMGKLVSSPAVKSGVTDKGIKSH